MDIGQCPKRLYKIMTNMEGTYPSAEALKDLELIFKYRDRMQTVWTIQFHCFKRNKPPLAILANPTRGIVYDLTE